MPKPEPQAHRATYPKQSNPARRPASDFVEYWSLTRWTIRHRRSPVASTPDPGSMIGACGGGWRTSRAPGESRSPRLAPGGGAGFASPPSRFCRGWVAVDHLDARGDIANTVGPDFVPASVRHLDGLLSPLAAYLDALEARVAALERRLSAFALMTAADAARYARVNVKTILPAVRAGELAVAGHVGRSPRTSRDALNGWLAARSSAAAPVPSQPRRRRGRKASDAVEAAWQALG